MLTNLFFHDIPGVRVERVYREGHLIHLQATTTRRAARCPLCRRRSKRVHSTYIRTLADLPCVDSRVLIHLRTRRFVCRMRWCRRKIFTERLPQLVAPSARRTTRLTDRLRREGVALGGEAGARQVRAAGMPVSPRTLLRLIRTLPGPADGPVRVLGIDDWSYRKGRSYGTILVDLEAHAVLDLLPDRTTATVAAWLVRHPEIEVISRDRAGAYAEAARLGAPQAIQIADRWHMLKNLTETVEDVLRRHHAAVRRAAQPPPSSAAPTTADTLQATSACATPRERRSRADHQTQVRRERRLARYDEVVALHAQGVGQREIATRLQIGRHTVRRYLRSHDFPERVNGTRRRPLLAPYEAYLRARWAAGERNATRLWQEIRERGYQGAARNVRAYLASWRAQPARPGPTPQARPATAVAASPPPPTYSPRQAAWLLLRRPEGLDPEEQAYVARLIALCPDIGPVQQLAHAFQRLMRERIMAALVPWLHAAEASGIPEMHGFAGGLRADQDAVTAALVYAWSQGQVEGSVNKLKLIKRSGYGRARIDLLCRRLVEAA